MDGDFVRSCAGSLAVTSGVHTAADALKVFLAGGDVAMMASDTAAERGPEYMRNVIRDIENVMGENGYSSCAN